MNIGLRFHVDAGIHLTEVCISSKSGNDMNVMEVCLCLPESADVHLMVVRVRFRRDRDIRDLVLVEVLRFFCGHWVVGWGVFFHQNVPFWRLFGVPLVCRGGANGADRAVPHQQLGDNLLLSANIAPLWRTTQAGATAD